MTKDDRLELVAPCGIDCGLCSLHLCGDDPELMDRLVTRGISRERLPCAGCRNIAGDCPVIGRACETYACICREGVGFCFECDGFPCSKLCPAADRAELLPHNLKIFNLCTIKRIGVEGFVEASGNLERLYFKGTMEIGDGPKLAD